MCDAGYDSDWGADKSLMHFKIEKAPFFAATAVTGGKPSGGLCQHAAVCTDGEYRVLKADKSPIPGKLNSVRETVFHSLGLDPKSCHTYGDKSILRGGKPSLEKYKPKAEDILKSTVGN